MKINDYLKENNCTLNTKLADLVSTGIKKEFPCYYHNCIRQKWSNYVMVNYLFNLDLEEKYIIKIAKYVKLYTFS